MGVMGVFLVDFGATLLRRAINRFPIFTGDRSHIYDQLNDRSWSIRRIALLAGAVQGVFAVIFLGLLVAEVGFGTTLVAIGLGVIVTLVLLWRLGFLEP
jgi:hypothetical protein